MSFGVARYDINIDLPLQVELVSPDSKKAKKRDRRKGRGRTNSQDVPIPGVSEIEAGGELSAKKKRGRGRSTARRSASSPKKKEPNNRYPIVTKCVSFPVPSPSAVLGDDDDDEDEWEQPRDFICVDECADSGMDVCGYEADGEDYTFLQDNTWLDIDTFERMVERCERAVWQVQTEAFQMGSNPNLSLPFHLTQECCMVCQRRARSMRNLMVQCDACGVVAHQGCMVLHTVQKGSRWRCDYCVNGLQLGKNLRMHIVDPNAPARGRGRGRGSAKRAPTTPIICALCPNGITHGPMIRTHDKKLWVHPSCALWLGGLVLSRKGMIRTVKLGDLQRDTRRKKGSQASCCLCRGRGDNMMDCSYEGCPKRFHISCASVDDNLRPDFSSIVHEDVSLAVVRAKEGKRGKTPSYMKNHRVLADGVVYCPDHVDSDAHEVQITLDEEDDWMQVYSQMGSWLGKGKKSAPLERVDAFYEHWVKRRKEHGHPNGEVPLLRELETEFRSMQRAAKRNKKEKKRLHVPEGSSIHVPITDPLYNKMVTLRLQMDRARTISDMVIRREKHKKNLLVTDSEILELMMNNPSSMSFPSGHDIIGGTVVAISNYEQSSASSKKKKNQTHTGRKT